MNPIELVAHIQAAIERYGGPDMLEILSHLKEAAKYRSLAEEQIDRGAPVLAKRLHARAETFLSNARILAQIPS